jgi:hypothetical protein
MDTREQIAANIELWSAEEFGSADLGNTARVRRLVLMAERAARHPAGKITEVFQTSAEREGAYKFLESLQVDASSIAQASHIACAARCEKEPFVFVPVDGSSLSLTDPEMIKEGLGPVGNRSKKGRGLEVMNAIAVRPDGTPLGICGQAFWAREEKKRKAPKKKRTMKEKETRFWFEAMRQTMIAFLLARSKCLPWFQMDRGGDFHELLSWAGENELYVTVRAAHDRRVLDADGHYLWETVECQKPLGQYSLTIHGSRRRKARNATMEIRMSPVTFWLSNSQSEEKKRITLTAVQTREVGTVPADELPVQWMLLTNYPVKTFKDACLVVYGYTQRWRVEEFHKTWKSVCGIEETLLEESSRIIKWAIIMSAVAMRIERLKYLARNTPEAPATEELTSQEIDTLIHLRQPKGYQPGDIPTIAVAVRWIADCGGYTGKSSGGPPGSIVIGRGLFYVAPAVVFLKNIVVKK